MWCRKETSAGKECEVSDDSLTNLDQKISHNSQVCKAAARLRHQCDLLKHRFFKQMGGVFIGSDPMFHTGSSAGITNFGKVNHGLSTVEAPGNQQKGLRKKTPGRSLLFVEMKLIHFHPPLLFPPKN